MSLATRGVVTDPRPHIAVRLDDGSIDQVSDLKWFRHYRIPCTMVLNFNSLRTSGEAHPSKVAYTNRMLRTQVRDAVRQHKALGIPIEAAQHSNSNWTGYGDAMTYQEILDEVDPTEMMAYLDVECPTYVQPGDAGVNDWCKANREQIVKALREHGIQYAFGLVPASADRTLGANGIVNATTEALNLMWATENSDGVVFQNGFGQRPGLCNDPHAFGDAYTIDLGSVVVTRGDRTDPTAVDPLSGAEPWHLGLDNGLGSADGDFDADVDRTWTWRYMRMLAMGLSGMVAMHGERRTNDQNVTLTTSGTKKYPDHFSVRHVLATLRALEDAGFIKLCLGSELGQHLYSDYAPGTELLQNPQTKIPHREINDMAVGDLPYPAGMTSAIAGQNARTLGSTIFIRHTADDANGIITTPTPVADSLGPGVTGVRGKTGGWGMRTGVSNDQYLETYMGFCGLPHGHYRLVFDLNHEDGALRLAKMMAVGERYALDVHDFLNLQTGVQGHVYQNQTPFAHFDGVQSNPQDGKPGTFEFPFYLPKEALAELTGKVASWAMGTLANGASDTQVVAVTGASSGLGQSIICRYEEDLKGCTISGEITGEDEVTVTVTNNTGAGQTITTGDLYVAVPLPAHGYNRAERLTALGPWVYQAQFRFAKDGTSEALFSDVRLYYDGA